MNTIISSIIASSVVAAIVSGLVSYWLKNLDFKNEYYKTIIGKRLESYTHVERVILLLQTKVSIDLADVKYHDVFENWEDFSYFVEDIKKAVYHGMWINKPTLILIEDLRTLCIEILYNSANKESITVGDKNYVQIEGIKNILEEFCRKDIFELHKIS